MMSQRTQSDGMKQCTLTMTSQQRLPGIRDMTEAQDKIPEQNPQTRLLKIPPMPMFTGQATILMLLAL